MKKQTIEELIAYYSGQLNVPGPADLDFIAQTHGHPEGTGQIIHATATSPEGRSRALAQSAVAEMVAASKHLSQYQIAKRSGLPESTVSRIWAGDQMPGLDTFIRLAWACDYRISIWAKPR